MTRSAEIAGAIRGTLFARKCAESLDRLRANNPEASIEGRRIRAVKIGDRTRSARPGILVIAGAHAREVVNPDMLLMLGLQLCKAVTDKAGLTFGGKNYGADQLRTLIERTDLYFVPLVNPDGRAFALSPKRRRRSARSIGSRSVSPVPCARGAS